MRHDQVRFWGQLKSMENALVWAPTDGKGREQEMELPLGNINGYSSACESGIDA